MNRLEELKQLRNTLQNYVVFGAPDISTDEAINLLAMIDNAISSTDATQGSTDANLRERIMNKDEVERAIATITELINDAWKRNENSFGHQEFISETRTELRNARAILPILQAQIKPECEWCKNVQIQPQPPQTNSERTRAMTDEQLAVEYAKVNNCFSCRFGNVCEEIRQSSRCIKLLTDWYKSPSGEKP